MMVHRGCVWEVLMGALRWVLAVVPRARMCCQPVGLVVLCAGVGVLMVLRFGQDLFKIPPSVLPTPLSASPLYPSRLPLIDLMDFAYVINNDVCDGRDVFAAVIVHTHPSHRHTRDTHRKHLPSDLLAELGVVRLFLMARAEADTQEKYPRTPQEVITAENLEHQDIVQGNFVEHYHNLTYKHVMGLQWVARYCPAAAYVIKMDDDIAVDLVQLRDLLRYRHRARTRLILGLLQMDARPIRNPASKWYVSEADFPDDTYAAFVSGWAYAMTLDAAALIVAESLKAPYFWIDDVHVTGTLAARAGVRREGLNRYYTLHVAHLHCCVEMPRAEEYLCDFLAGPTDDDPGIMAAVLSHARQCYVSGCVRRPPEQRLSLTCVRAQVPPLMPLQEGHGEIIKVFR